MMAGPHHAAPERIPRPAADVVAEVVEGEVLVYHPRQTRALYLNATAAAVWGLCDGRRSVAAIIEMFGRSYPEAAVAADVLATLSDLQQSGVLVLG